MPQDMQVHRGEHYCSPDDPENAGTIINILDEDGEDFHSLEPDAVRALVIRREDGKFASISCPAGLCYIQPSVH